MSEERDKFLKRLSGIDSILWFSDNTNGYGVSGEAYLLKDEGFYGGVPVNTPQPEIISQGEYDEALEIINSEDFDEDEYYNEIVEMVKSGCQPNIEYYQDDGTDYMNREEYEEYIADAVTNTDFTSWDDLETEELEHWCSILDDIEKK